MLNFRVLPLVVILMGLAACNAAPATVAVLPTATPVAATATPISLPATFTPTPSPIPSSTNTFVPTATPLATDTLTLTPTPEPLVRLSDSAPNAVNVRSGPGVNYPIVAQMTHVQTATLLGRNEVNDWWQIQLGEQPEVWVSQKLVTFTGDSQTLAVIVTPTPPSPPTANPNITPTPASVAETATPNAAELADKLKCGKDFCVTYQAMVPIGENGGCIGNHSIYITVLQGPPPGQPMDGVVIGDTYNNVSVASGDRGPGRTEITLWSNSMTLIAKRNVDGTPYTSQESFNFSTIDEVIPAEILAAAGYCDGSVENCEWARNHNQVCRGHYSWRVTFHKFD